MDIKRKIEILGVIPARGGSKGLPNKNTKLLNGIPLIGHAILRAKKSKLINRVVVVTDDRRIASIAKRYGAEIPFQRPAELSSDLSHIFEIYKFTVNWFKENERYRPDIVCTMLCTAPFTRTSYIDSCLKKMVETGCDWCFTVNETEHHPYRAMIIKKDRMVPVFDVSRKLLWANRQELPIMYRFNGGVIACRTDNIERYNEYNIDKRRFKNVDVRCVIMKRSDSLDIDTAEDFEFAKILARRRRIFL